MKFEIDWKGEKFLVEWSDETNFEDLKNVGGVAGFIFDDHGRFCIVKTKGKEAWNLPGGGPEKEDKSFENTLIREVIEEADLEIKNIKRLGYLKSKLKEKKDWKNYQLRYIAEVKNINPQTIDPAENAITKRKFIVPNDFNEYCGWGKNGEFQLNKALKMMKE
jgi:8-oxo-dGTP pyrophosphatase MutT (NUDIX family)